MKDHILMFKNIILGILFLLPNVTSTQEPKPIKINEDWLTKIEHLAPEKTYTPFNEVKKILVFSKATGFKHWVIPHNEEVFKILARKSKAFEIHVGYDIQNFSKANLKKYDALILNNSNPSAPNRDLFYDLLEQNTTLNKAEIVKRAKLYEQNVMDFVTDGGGLMILHGAISVQNNSISFSKMTGGSFDYHPKQQEIHVKKVEENHPLTSAFSGKGFKHFDEPYFFKNAYFDHNFKPLLYMEVDKIEGLKNKVEEKVIYVSWIKRHGKGRVFYCSPSHNAQSFENPELLQYFLNGLQYVVGDIACDDSPIKQP